MRPHGGTRKIQGKSAASLIFRNTPLSRKRSGGRSRARLGPSHIAQHALHHVVLDAEQAVIHIEQDCPLGSFNFLRGESALAFLDRPVSARAKPIHKEPMRKRQSSEDNHIGRNMRRRTARCICPQKSLDFPLEFRWCKDIPPRRCKLPT